MGMQFNGINPKSENGKRFHMNNKGWSVVKSVIEQCDVEFYIHIQEEIEFHENFKLDLIDANLLADAIKQKDSYSLNKQTEEYRPLIEEFAKFCKESGGFKAF